MVSREISRRRFLESAGLVFPALSLVDIASGSDDGSVSKEPCREVGLAFERLDLRLRNAVRNGTKGLRLGKSTIVTNAYHADEDNAGEVFRTNEGEVFVIQTFEAYYRIGDGDNAGDYKRLAIDSSGKVSFRGVGGGMAPSLEKLFRDEDESRKKGGIPNDAFTITPAVDVKMIGELDNQVRIGYDLKAGDIIVRDNRVKGIHSDVFRYNPNRGHYEEVSHDERNVMTPRQLSEFIGPDFMAIQVNPYTYGGSKIADSRGGLVGTYNADPKGAHLYVPKEKVLYPGTAGQFRKSETFTNMHELRKRFESKPLHEYFAKG